MVNVLVNGVGVIGKRVAHAVHIQKDMKLFGIADAFPTSALRTNTQKGAPLYGVNVYASNADFVKNFSEGTYPIQGTLEDALKTGKVDVVVDCTPKGVDAKNKPLYERYGVKVIFQGGANANIAHTSFNAFANYNEAKTKQFVRVVSCNTTSIIRTLYTLSKKADIKEVHVSLVRRGTDPWDAREGPMNAIVPVPYIPSHHGPDVNTVLKNIKITTMAVKVPTTLAHVHMVHAKIKTPLSREQLVTAFMATPRVAVLKAAHGFDSTASVHERYRDLLRPRYDMPEVVIWDETISVQGKDVHWMHMVHSESIVIPENIDAIRAMTGLESSAKKSVEKTDASFKYTAFG